MTNPADDHNATPPTERRPQRPRGAPRNSLSPREHQIVLAIANGLTNRQIAEELKISIRTVERHIENIYVKLNVRGKAARTVVTTRVLRGDL